MRETKPNVYLYKNNFLISFGTTNAINFHNKNTSFPEYQISIYKISPSGLRDAERPYTIRVGGDQKMACVTTPLSYIGTPSLLVVLFIYTPTRSFVGNMSRQIRYPAGTLTSNRIQDSSRIPLLWRLPYFRSLGLQLLFKIFSGRCSMIVWVIRYCELFGVIVDIDIS